MKVHKNRTIRWYDPDDFATSRSDMIWQYIMIWYSMVWNDMKIWWFEDKKRWYNPDDCAAHPWHGRIIALCEARRGLCRAWWTSVIHQYTNTRPGEVCVDQAPIKCSFGCQRKETKKLAPNTLSKILSKTGKNVKLTSRDKKGASFGSQGPWPATWSLNYLSPRGLGWLPGALIIWLPGALVGSQRPCLASRSLD